MEQTKTEQAGYTEQTETWKNGWVAITVNGNRQHVSGVYQTLYEAREMTKHNVGNVTCCSVRYRVS